MGNPDPRVVCKAQLHHLITSVPLLFRTDLQSVKQKQQKHNCIKDCKKEKCWVIFLKNCFCLKQILADCFPKVVKAGWPLGSGGICHRSYANPLSLGPECGEGTHGCVLANRYRMLPPAFLSISFDHFLLWPSTRCTSQGVPLQGKGEKLAFTSYLTVYNEFFCPHTNPCAFVRKTLISEWIFPHMVLICT